MTQCLEGGMTTPSFKEKTGNLESPSTPQAAQECPDHFQLPEPLLPGICSYPHFLTRDSGPSLCHSKSVTADAAAAD